MEGRRRRALNRLRAEASHTFASLEHRNFALHFWSQTISISGTWLQMMAQTLLALRLSDSGTVLGLLTAMQFCPALVLGAWAGVAIDRLPRRRVMEVCSITMLVVAGALGALTVMDRITLTWLFVFAGISGLVNTFDNTARRALVSELVPVESLPNAVSLNSTVVTAARLVGPALAGILVTTVGIGWCFLLNAVTFVAPLLSFRRMGPEVWLNHVPLQDRRGALRAGLRYAWANTDVKVPLLLTAVVGAFGYNAQVVLPLLAKRELGGTEATFTLLAAAGSIGMLAGSLWLARRRVITTRLVSIGAVSFGFANGLLGVAPDVPSAFAASVATGFAAVCILSGANTVVQLAASVAMRTRMLALFNVVFLGSTPVGGPIVGMIAETAGTRPAIAFGAVLSVLVGGVAVASLDGGRRRAPVQPIDPDLPADPIVAPGSAT